jgi:spore maturation protein CgeB
VRLLYEGPFWYGSTSLQRVAAFRRIPGLNVVALDTGFVPGNATSLWSRVRWRLRYPIDTLAENKRLIETVQEHSPDVVFVDSSKVLTRSTLTSLRTVGVSKLVFYTPDDILAPHNLSRQLRRSFADWDVFFTTKTFSISELSASGVKRPVLVGNAYAPELHRPLQPSDVGAEFERFDLVFVGTYEQERCGSIRRLAESGFDVIVYGSGWTKKSVHSRVVTRGPVYGHEYTKALHQGRLALGFLRKINRDRVTTRSVEIPAMGRPMVAERTDEHDAYFRDGVEYAGFSSDEELISLVGVLLKDDQMRSRLAAAGRDRCLNAGYSTDCRGQEMLSEIEAGC